MEEEAKGAAAAGGGIGVAPGRAPSSRSVSPAAAAAAAAAGAGAGKQTKRKASASPSPGGGGGVGKKKAKAPSVAPPQPPQQLPPSAALCPSSLGPPTDAEIAAAIRERGPMASSALTAMFKARLAGADAKKAFTAAVKRVAKLEERDGTKVIVLR